MPLTIFKRLVLGNIAILFLVMLLGGTVSYKLLELQKLSREIVSKNQESLLIGERLLDEFSLLIQMDEKYFVVKDQDYLNGFYNHKAQIEKELSRYADLIENQQQKISYDSVLETFQNYTHWFQTTADSTEMNFDYDLLASERAPFVPEIRNHIKNIIIQSRQIVNKKTEVSSSLTQQIFMMTVATTLLTIMVGMFITVLNTRSIVTSVDRIQHKTHKIAKGYFEEIKTFKGPKELQDLSENFNSMCRQLRELDILKADFINHVSHELRTPLTSIKEASTMLSKGFYKDFPEKQRELIVLIDEESQRLLKSIMRILDLSKMEARKMEYQKEKTHLPELIRQSILKLALLAEKKNISFEFAPPPDALPDVNVDRDRIIEVLDNLIGNALKFTPERGQVMVLCKYDESESEVMVSVIDNGPGIPLEDLEKIFYKFKQIDNHLNTRMGTGLGLTLSKHIIQAHGGKIWAKNRKSTGAILSFTLPVSL